MAIILFNKPFNVLSQFTGEGDTLSKYIKLAGFYPAGRLDKHSEGLLVLTDNGKQQHQIAHPSQKISKTYWAQVEGVPKLTAIKRLEYGVKLSIGRTQPAQCKVIKPPYLLTPRQPPIRVRKNIADTWLQLTINEGKNRQIRKMCAKVGLPVLRLIRYRVGSWTLDGIEVGEYRILHY